MGACATPELFHTCSVWCWHSWACHLCLSVGVADTLGSAQVILSSRNEKETLWVCLRFLCPEVGTDPPQRMRLRGAHTCTFSLCCYTKSQRGSHRRENYGWTQTMLSDLCRSLMDFFIGGQFLLVIHTALFSQWLLVTFSMGMINDFLARACYLQNWLEIVCCWRLRCCLI